MTRALMFQGTGSDVGKSLLTAAFCRLAMRRGISVAPFKPQNMSNNAAVCSGGGEIGRAQALQARAAGLDPHVDFNPILLKPQSDRSSQIIIHGKVHGLMSAHRFMEDRRVLLDAVLESFTRLQETYDLVLIEGAGSPAETNLRQYDIANMGFALAADVPVCLVGDIEKGGVIASLVGTHAVLSKTDRQQITGFLINKFRGDVSLFDEGLRTISDLTGWPAMGVVPWLHGLSALPSEDSIDIARPRAHDAKTKRLKIVAPMLSRIANFDDADPLIAEEYVDFQWVSPGCPLPRDADVVILFGSKSTLAEMDFLSAQGWDIDILAHVRAGGHVLGICGGYQLLATNLFDPDGVDGPVRQRQGLGLLNVDVSMIPQKTVRTVRASCAHSGAGVDGYEIHVGQIDRQTDYPPMMLLGDVAEGCSAQDGKIEGTHLHGIFANDAFRQHWLARKGGLASQMSFNDALEAGLDHLASQVEQAVDVEAILASAR